MKIQALLFDLGKVLIDFNFDTGIRALHACCSVSREKFDQVLWDETWICRYERGEASPRRERMLRILAFIAGTEVQP